MSRSQRIFNSRNDFLKRKSSSWRDHHVTMQGSVKIIQMCGMLTVFSFRKFNAFADSYVLQEEKYDDKKNTLALESASVSAPCSTHSPILDKV